MTDRKLDSDVGAPVTAAQPTTRRKARRAGAALLLATLLAGCAGRIMPPPPALGLDPFYEKSLNARGIPISSSAAVPDAALRRARNIVDNMLARRSDLALYLVGRHQRVVVMAQSEGTVDLPEQRDWKKPGRDDPRLTYCERKLYDQRIGRLTDREYWNRRARGMGGRLTSAATENLLAIRGTRYYGENILVHEFSHALLDAVRGADPTLYAEVQRSFAAAEEKKLWEGEYGATTIQEYWAEGTQFWFNSNKVAVIRGKVVLSDRDLASYDPGLVAVLRQVYGDRHRVRGDAFWMSRARVPPGGVPASTAEVC